MPLSEFSKLAKGKQKSARQNSATFSAQPSSSLHGSDFVELVWENGQVVMQGQPSRGRKHSDNISSLVNLRQKGSARGENPEMGGVGMMDSIMNDFQIPDPPQLDEHDDIVPWLSYHIDDEPVQQNFTCDFFSELSGLTAADPHPTSLQNFTALPTRPRTSQLDQASAVNPMQTQRRPSSTVMNFPHFAAMVKPSLDAKTSQKANPSRLPSDFQESRKMDISPKQAKVPHGKAAEPLLASSVCSGSSGASKDPTYGSKRKNHESEDSDCPTEEAEEESVGINKASKNRARSGSKRIRAAEVHNLSERRRRDRINEKMRALQELIPNCNKVDKASMLDEAIEYLKTLQFQVQMMSMGSGFFMPPMMLPHIPRFGPMGMGYGYGMLDMNGNSFTHPLVQMSSSSSSVPGTRFLAAQVSGLDNLNVTPPTNLAMFGSQGQGVAMLMPQAPPISFPTSPPIRPVQDLNTKTSAPTSQSKEPEPSTQS